MEKSINYDYRVFLHAARACYFNMMWVYSSVGGPSIYFGWSGTIFEKAIFFFLGSIVFWLPLLLACVLFHGKSLKTVEDIDYFNSLTNKEKGVVIGEYIF